jgi:hypothetical protein
MNPDDTPEEGKFGTATALRRVVDTQERWQLTAVTAFYLAEARGFAPGGELEDWLEAERRVDAGLIAAAVPVDAVVGAKTPAEAPAAAPVKRARRTATATPATGVEGAPRKRATAARKTGTRGRKSAPGIEADLGGTT